MTINIREARAGDYLVTPAGKKRIEHRGHTAIQFAGGECVSSELAEFFGFTVEREEEWHEHENLGYALECVRRGEEAEALLGDTWCAWFRSDTMLLFKGNVDGYVGELFAWTRFRTRSAPSSEVLAELDCEVWGGDIRLANSIDVLAVAREVGTVSIPDGTPVKVQVVR